MWLTRLGLRQLRFRLQKHILVKVVHHDPRSGIDQALGNGSPDTPPGSGHQRGLAFQSERDSRHAFRFSFSPSESISSLLKPAY